MITQPQKTAASPHKPVLLGPVIEALAPCDGGLYVDGTFGAGGYSRAILSAADCIVYAIDRDPDAIADGAGLVQESNARLVLVEGEYGNMAELLAAREVDAVNGVTLDIGVSSMQLDQAQRGFSFLRDGPLDMRMSRKGLSAADVVNGFAPGDLKRIIKIFGEEKKAHQIAAAICRERKVKAFETTLELAGLIEKVVGVPPHRRTIHPATRTFQALRIFVNAELDELVRGLHAAEKLLKPGGRLAVVTFHSLEDRIVKRFLKKRSGDMPNPSRHAPQPIDVAKASFEVFDRGGVTAREAEIDANPRARSARLRWAVRTDAPAIKPHRSEMAAGLIEGLMA